jgi:murein L,D-transpeptidase YcbB/YkuD
MRRGQDNDGVKAQANEADIRQRIIMNMERWRWMPAALGPLYVWSNTPEFMLYVVKDGKAILLIRHKSVRPPIRRQSSQPT